MMLQRAGRELKPDWTLRAVLGLRRGRTAISAFVLTLTTTIAVADPDARWWDGTGLPRGLVKFDIPAQPLSDALFMFSSVTGIEILVPGDILARRQSSGVTGVRPSGDALRILLAGTGLAPRNTGTSAFTLVPVAPDAPLMAPHTPRFPQYSAAIQAAVTSGLCRLRETRPGDYRVAARLWIGPSGAVMRVSFLGTTGNADRDAALTGLLGRLVISEAPPANLPQPTTVVVLPRLEKTADCSPGSAGAAR
jgi:hypothetical protein